MASEAMGAIKAAKAKVEGRTGVFAELSKEHGKVTALLLRVKASSDPKVRAELFPKIRAELLSHEKGELLDVYPVFREYPALVDFADEHDREAQQLEKRLSALAETEFGDERWPDLFSELVEVVTQHVKDEENRFFPAASRKIGREQSERMLKDFETTKRLAMQNLP
jgi:hemerythrin superfamily protein